MSNFVSKDVNYYITGPSLFRQTRAIVGLGAGLKLSALNDVSPRTSFAG